MIVVGVDVNEAWSNNPVGSVEFHISVVVGQVSDIGDGITLDTNICLTTWRTRAIDYVAIPDDEVVS
jgi:hypothetical protein